MIKGAQKQLIVVRTGGNPYFDEAYFVLRREIESQKHKKSDILKEANRILEESTLHKHRKKRSTSAFFYGSLQDFCAAGSYLCSFFCCFFEEKQKKMVVF